MRPLIIDAGAKAEIARVMKLANREHIPVTPRGGGSGLSGGAVPVHGGIVLSLDRIKAKTRLWRRYGKHIGSMFWVGGAA